MKGRTTVNDDDERPTDHPEGAALATIGRENAHSHHLMRNLITG